MLLLTSDCSSHLVTLSAPPIRCLCVAFVRVTIFFTITITFSSDCSCCFRPTATWLLFRCWPKYSRSDPIYYIWLKHAHQPVYRLLSWAKLPIFSGNFATIVRYPKPSFRNISIRALYWYHILLITKVIGPGAIMTWTIEEFRAMLHVNIKIMTHIVSQQRWYLLLNYFNNKINFLFSCEIRSWSLSFRQFDTCQVNTAQSNTLMHSIVPNKWAKFGAKVFRHFWDIALFVLGYFILPHPV